MDEFIDNILGQPAGSVELLPEMESSLQLPAECVDCERTRVGMERDAHTLAYFALEHVRSDHDNPTPLATIGSLLAGPAGCSDMYQLDGNDDDDDATTTAGSPSRSDALSPTLLPPIVPLTTVSCTSSPTPTPSSNTQPGPETGPQSMASSSLSFERSAMEMAQNSPENQRVFSCCFPACSTTPKLNILRYYTPITTSSCMRTPTTADLMCFVLFCLSLFIRMW